MYNMYNITYKRILCYMSHIWYINTLYKCLSSIALLLPSVHSSMKGTGSWRGFLPSLLPATVFQGDIPWILPSFPGLIWEIYIYIYICIFIYWEKMIHPTVSGKYIGKIY